MLGQRRRRWASIKPTMGQCLVHVVSPLSAMITSEVLAQRETVIMENRPGPTFSILQSSKVLVFTVETTLSLSPSGWHSRTS